MPEIGEKVAFDLMTPEKDNCWYCTEQPEQPAENKLDEDPGSVDSAENSMANSSSKLGQALGHRPSWSAKLSGEEVDITPAAHHLIPGNASLKKATKLLKFMKKGDTVDGDVGYDVNDRKNGVWLPTYPASGWGTLDQDAYAIQAMKAAGAQFHNAHAQYNQRASQSLSEIADKLVKKNDKCPICGDTLKNAKRPPFGLVGRLNALSRRYRGFLKGSPRRWPTESGILTSEKSKLMKSL
ncbi:hypothetical protein BE17_17235 [Sorangium cellulosum]|uniref:Uncharacterized protein n=1 Tax=Sorangium cellulosum TaxID=56 RepID=A0A150RSV6_SORCE|nr:hypothetical protein BE17_17235 [Sorangium cellulosum]